MTINAVPVSMRVGAGGILEPIPPVSGDPYDLSAFTFGFAVIWPTPPQNITNFVTINSGDSAAAFANAVAVSNSQITVNAGYTGSGNMDNWGDDIDIIMSNFATITSECGFAAASRIRWTGGNVIGGDAGMSGRGMSDILIDNVNVDTTGDIGFYMLRGNVGDSGTILPYSRVALINSTFHGNGQAGNGWGIFGPAPSTGRCSNLIIANCNTSTTNYQSLRIGTVDNMVLVDTVSGPSGTASGWRLAYGTRVHQENCIGFGNSLFNTGSPAVVNSQFTNVNNYRVASNTWFANQDGANSGTVKNCTIHDTTGTPGSLIISPLSNGGGNSVVSWDGSTVDWTINGALPGRTSAADFGADH